jgi:hypothetical protein
MPEPYEIHVEEDEGFVLSEQSRPWKGWRVKYRTLGSKGRWSRFLTEDDISAVDIPTLQRMCALHEAHR